MSLLEKLKAGKRNIRIIKFPGTDQDVALRILSNAERQEALFATEYRFKQKEIELSSATAEAYDDENTTQILAVALRDPDDAEKPFAKNADQMRKLLNLEEKNALVAEYAAFEEEASPLMEKLSEDDLERIFNQVKKKPVTVSDLSMFSLRELITYLASRPAK